ncbi:MAG: hypothetical protein E6J20_21145, partial [Chloroflexi bacterium]
MGEQRGERRLGELGAEVAAWGGAHRGPHRHRVSRGEQRRADVAPGRVGQRPGGGAGHVLGAATAGDGGGEVLAEQLTGVEPARLDGADGGSVGVWRGQHQLVGVGVVQPDRGGRRVALEGGVERGGHDRPRRSQGVGDAGRGRGGQGGVGAEQGDHRRPGLGLGADPVGARQDRDRARRPGHPAELAVVRGGDRGEIVGEAGQARLDPGGAAGDGAALALLGVGHDGAMGLVDGGLVDRGEVDADQRGQGGHGEHRHRQHGDEDSSVETARAGAAPEETWHGGGAPTIQALPARIVQSKPLQGRRRSPQRVMRGPLSTPRMAAGCLAARRPPRPAGPSPSNRVVTSRSPRRSSAVRHSRYRLGPLAVGAKTWDPGKMDAEVDTELMQNVYDNLWRFDDKLGVIPDIATDVPTQANGGISADGKTYTVHLNPAVKFNNGDAVTSKDVLYSWNRAAALRGAYRSSLGAIAGYKAVDTAAKAFCNKTANLTACLTTVEQKLAANDPSVQMSGLTAPDPETVQIKLTSACGWCVAAWTLQGSVGSIVDEKVIKGDPVTWWQKPGGPGVTDGQVGTGAYYMSQYTSKQSITFKQVSGWWGSPKPTLTEVDIDIKDPATQTTNDAAWEQGHYDLIGYGGNSTQPLADILRYNAGGTFKDQLHLVPKGRTTWLSFNIGYPATGGPFLGESDAAKGLRKAFALAVDKDSLATTVCHNVQCAPANGGLITKGLAGYGGDNTDPLAKFDPTQAKQLLQQFDPTGSKTS